MALGSTCAKFVVACFQVLSQDLCGSTEEIHDKIQWNESLSRPK